jgi:hypothetical protein
MIIFIWLKRFIVFIVLFFLIDFLISSLLLTGLNKYFGLNSNAKILVNGSSLAMAGFNRTKIESVTNKSVAFYSRNGVTLEDRKLMLEHYFNTTIQKPDIVVFEVNPLLFSKRSTAANVYMLFLPFMDDPAINEFIKNKTTFKDYFIRKFIKTSRFNLDLFSLSLNGYFGMYENKKTQVLDEKSLKGLKKRFNSVTVEFDMDKVELFKRTIAFAKSNSNKIILVNMPIFESKMQTFKNEEYQVFISFIKKYSRSHQNILFLDLNKSVKTSNPNFFSDPLHLNFQGQFEATKSLTDFINFNELNKSKLRK